MSACALVPCTYKHFPKNKTLLKQAFFKLCADKMPLVWRAAAMNIGDLAWSVEPEIIESEIIPQFEKLSNDEQDYVKLITFDHLHDIAEISPNNETLIQITQNAIKDSSWKVRLSIAKQTDKLVQSFGKLVASHHLLDDLSQLLRDPEGEVKRELVHAFTKCIKLLDLSKIKEFLLPVFKDTYKDDYANFKEGVAESICEIAFILDEHDVTDELIPILQELMKDKSSGVKIKVVEGLAKLSKVLGP